MSLNNCLVMKFLASDLTVREQSEVAVYMGVEFGLAGDGEEHVEDWLERFCKECRRRPQPSYDAVRSESQHI